MDAPKEKAKIHNIISRIGWPLIGAAAFTSIATAMTFTHPLNSNSFVSLFTVDIILAILIINGIWRKLRKGNEPIPPVAQPATHNNRPEQHNTTAQTKDTGSHTSAAALDFDLLDEVQNKHRHIANLLLVVTFMIVATTPLYLLSIEYAHEVVPEKYLWGSVLIATVAALTVRGRYINRKYNQALKEKEKHLTEEHCCFYHGNPMKTPTSILMSNDKDKDPQQEHKIMGTVWGVPIKKPTYKEIAVTTIFAIMYLALCIYLVPVLIPVSIRLLCPWLQYYLVIAPTLWGTIAFLFDIFPMNGWKHTRLWITALLIEIIGVLPAMPSLYNP